MQGIAGVEFLQGDFREESVLRELEALLEGHKVDLVLSDMAPNMSGVALADQIRAMDLADLALDFSRQWLKPGGSFLIKLFQGVGFDEYLRSLRADFARVTMRKPKASRARSREVYALAVGRKRHQRATGRESRMNETAKNVLLWLIIAVVLLTVFQSFNPHGGGRNGHALQRVRAERGQRQRRQRHDQRRSAGDHQRQAEGWQRVPHGRADARFLHQCGGRSRCRTRAWRCARSPPTRASR